MAQLRGSQNAAYTTTTNNNNGAYIKTLDTITTAQLRSSSTTNNNNDGHHRVTKDKYKNNKDKDKKNKKKNKDKDDDKKEDDDVEEITDLELEGDNNKKKESSNGSHHGGEKDDTVEINTVSSSSSTKSINNDNKKSNSNNNDIENIEITKNGKKDGGDTTTATIKGDDDEKDDGNGNNDNKIKLSFTNNEKVENKGSDDDNNITSNEEEEEEETNNNNNNNSSKIVPEEEKDEENDKAAAKTNKGEEGEFTTTTTDVAQGVISNLQMKLREMGNIVEITDYEAPELDIYARLTDVQLLNRFDPTKGMFIAETSYVIMRALEGGYEPVSILAERGRTNGHSREREAVIEACGDDIPTYVSGMDVLAKLTGFRLTKGMLCAMKRPAPRTTLDVLRNTRRVVVLERVQNPTNIGAIFRSAAALGMDAVLLTPGCSDPLYRRCARVSMGAVFQIPWTHTSGDWMEELRDMGYKTAAMALRDDSYSIDAPELREVDRLAIVLGAEGSGLLDETIDGCDYTVKIPMHHGVDSLNVAAASALAFWELRKI